METLLSDLRFGARMLLKRPGFAAMAILTMALGIGANTAIFTVVNALLLRPPAYVEPERVMTLWVHGANIDRETCSLPDFVDWREQNTVFSSMGAATLGSVNVTGEGDPERVIGARVTAQFLETLGVAPAMGRNFIAAEDVPHAESVAVLSDAFWRRRFGGDPAAVGRTVELNGVVHRIVGVLPASFKYPDATKVDVFAPLAMAAADKGRRSDFLEVYARLKPGVTAAAATEELGAIASRLEAQYPETNTSITVQVVPLTELRVEKSRPALYVLLGAVAFVLMIACANVANLLLARSAARHREIAVRVALGAGRWRIARQVLTESVLLAVIGGVVGLLVAPWATELLVLAVPGDVQQLADVSVDKWVVAFALGLATLTGVLFGLAPALQVSRIGAGEALKESGRGTAGDTRRGLRGVLVASQVGLALVLLVGVGLMLRSFQRLQGVDLGFETTGKLTARVNLPAARYDEDPKIVAFYDGVRQRLAAMPGVTSVGAINALPILGGGPFLTFAEQNAPPPSNGASPDANVRVVDAGYLTTMSIPLQAGRTLLESDGPDAPSVCVVNRAAADRHWAGRNPIGLRIAFDGTDNEPHWREIVGIVGDVRHEGPDAPEVPAVYVPYAQRPVGSLALVVKTDGDPTRLVDGVRGAVREVDPTLPVFGVTTLESALGDALAPRRYTLMLLGLFGLIAVVLAAVGIYGVMSYLVAQRTQEIGIRMALGAERSTVLRLVLRQGLAMAAAGVAFGGLAAFWISRLIASQLYEISPTDPIAFVGATALLVAVAALACFVPARRATRVEPMVALHYE